MEGHFLNKMGMWMSPWFELKFSAAKKISVRFYCRDISQPFMFGQNRFQVLDLFRFFNFLLFFHLSLLSNRQVGFGKQHKRIVSTKVKIVKKFRSVWSGVICGTGFSPARYEALKIAPSS